MSSDWFKRTFAVSSGQLRFLTVMSVMALVLGTYLIITVYSEPTSESVSLPIIIGDADNTFVGLFVVDPNSSPVDSLELLPGVGPVLADRIAAYRQNNRFETEIDITQVKGIGPKLYEQIKPYLKVRR